MRKCIIIFLCCFCSLVNAQGLFEYFKLTADDDGPEKFDRIAVDLNYDRWLNTPKGIETGNFSIGVNAYWYKDIPLDSASHIAFAFGLGVSAHNVHHNGEFTTTQINGQTITQLNVRPTTDSWRKNKYLVSYLDMPFELRLRNMHIKSKKKNKTRSFRFYPGIKAGLLINDHTKWVTDDLKYKLYNMENILPYRYGLTAKLGFNKFVISAFYSLSPMFEKGKGPELYPISIGLSWIRL